MERGFNKGGNENRPYTVTERIQREDTGYET